MDQKRDGDQEDHQRTIKDHLPLKTKEQDHSYQKAGDGKRRDAGFERIDCGLSTTFDEAVSGNEASSQGQEHVKHHRQDQGFPRHGDVAYTEEEGDDGREGKDHDNVIHTHLNEGIGRVAARKV